MYRISFDPTQASFVIQTLSWGMFWTNVCDASFKTYSEAVTHVNAIGLGELYQDKSVNSRPSVMWNV